MLILFSVCLLVMNDFDLRKLRDFATKKNNGAPPPPKATEEFAKSSVVASVTIMVFIPIDKRTQETISPSINKRARTDEGVSSSNLTVA